MENFGLIIFDEDSMLIDKQTSTIDTTVHNCYIIVHEIAHQWFGNLVTMDWWNGLWLKEGFATWAGYLCTDKLLKSYNIWTAYVYIEIKDALNYDCLMSTRAIMQCIHVCHSITYSKASCIIRMVNSLMGEKEFQMALRDYMNRFKFSNANREDLCSYLNKHARIPIDIFVENWITQTGFPLVLVTCELDRSGNTILNLKQKRFLANGEDDESSGLWQIPITVSTKSSYPAIRLTYLMQTKTATLDLGRLLDNASDWILLNHDFVNFHRTFYSINMLRAISSDLNRLSSIDRLSLLSDTYAIVQAGLMSIQIFFDVLKSFSSETDAYVWKMISDTVISLYGLIMHTSSINGFRKMVIDLCKPISKVFGWTVGTNDDLNTLLCRETVQYLMALMFDDDAIDEGKRLFELQRDGKIQISGGLKKAVYTALLSSERYLDELFALYEDSEDIDETSAIVQALSTVQNQVLFDRVLNWSLKKASEDDALILLGYMAKNLGSPKRSTQVWNFIKKKRNWNFIVERYSDDELFGELLESVIQSLVTKTVEDDVKRFFEKNPVLVHKSIEVGLEKLAIRRTFLSRLKVDLTGKSSLKDGQPGKSSFLILRLVWN
jgi:puromycin-sensitive aminopeptidase